jgi:syntaxin 6
LDDISASITRIGQVGLTIGEELASQSKMLEDLEEDVDGVNARLQAAEKKMREVLKRAGLRGQLCVIFFLSVVLFILFYIALS